MALTLDVNGVSLAFGLNWASAPTGRGKSGQVADLGVRFRASHKVYLPKLDQYGFLEAGGRLRGGVKKGAALAGAALFASMVPEGRDSIFVFVVEAKKKAIIVVLADGRIYQDLVIPLGNGLDKSDSGVMREDGTFNFSEEAALRKVQEKIDQIYNETGKNFVPYGNFYQTFADSKPMDLEKLLERGPGDASLSKFADHRPAIKIGGVAIVLFGLFWGYQQYQKRERARKELELQQQQVDPMETYRASLSKALATARFTAADAKRSLLVPIVTREIELGGWALKKIVCSSAGSCAESWVRINGTARSFSEADTRQCRVTKYGNDLKSFACSYKIDAAPSRLDPSGLPKAEDYADAAIHLSQNLVPASVVVESTVEPSLEFALESGVTAKMVPAGQGVARAEVTVSGPIGVASSAIGALPDNLMVREAGYSISDGLDSHKFSIKGYYYVKK